jgi:ABC-type uncharacterized transport system substrate-binding protein
VRSRLNFQSNSPPSSTLVNLTTAKALGITISEQFLGRADSVIE